MAAFGLSGALAGLSAVPGGFQQGELDQFKIDDLRRQELAKKAMGQALMSLGGGMQPQMGGQPQGMPPPQPPAPGQMSQPRPPMGGGMPPGGAPAPQGGPPMAPPQMARPAQPPVQQGPQGLPQGNQPLDWRMIVQAIKQQNPNLDPAVMAEAVNQFLPMMTQQSQQEWRQISLQLREQALQQREHDMLMMEQGRNERAAAGRESREAEGAAGRESREKIAGERLQQSEEHFQQREKRLDESLKLREDSTYQRLEQQKQQALQRAQQAQGRQGLAEWRAAADAQYRYIRTKIQAESAATGLSPKDKKELLDQAEMQFNEQVGRLREQFGRSTPTGGTSPEPSTSKVEGRVPSAGAAPSVPPAAASPAQPAGAVAVPEAFKGDPDGTKYQKDGKTWIKQGGQLVPQG